MSILFIVIVILLVVWKVWLSKPENIGKAGEKRVARKLDWLPKEYITLNDILLPTGKFAVFGSCEVVRADPLSMELS